MVAIFMLVFLLNFFSPCSLHTFKYEMRNYIIWNFYTSFSIDCEVGVNKLQPKKTFQMMLCLIYISFFSMHYLCNQGHKRKLNLVFKNICYREVKACQTHKLKKVCPKFDFKVRISYRKVFMCYLRGAQDRTTQI